MSLVYSSIYKTMNRIEIVIGSTKTIDMKCPKCSTELIWGGDDDYEDYDAEGDGIVSNNGCPNEECDVETVIIYTN